MPITIAIESEAYNPSDLKRCDIWMLKLHLWDHVPEGVVPVRCDNSIDIVLDKSPGLPGLYVVKEFLFHHPPSRSDFITMQKCTPWMSSYDEFVRDVLPLNQWPIIDSHLKAARTPIFKDGREIGLIEVQRCWAYKNKSYPPPNFFRTEHKRLLKNDWADEYENLLRELMIQAGVQTFADQAVVIKRLKHRVAGQSRCNRQRSTTRRG